MLRLFGICLAALAMTLPLCAARAMAQSPQRTPLSAYAALPAISSVSVSDDGTELAYIRRQGEHTQVIVQRRTGEILVNVDVSDRLVSSVFWVSADHIAIRSRVLNSQLVAGREYLPQVDLVNVRTRGVARALRSADRGVINAAYGPMRGTWRGEPVLYVLAVTTEGQAYTPDIYRVDLNTGRGRRHATGADDTRDYILRPTGEVVARIGENSATGRFRISIPSGGGWRTALEVVNKLDGPAIWGFAQDPDKLMVSTLEDGQEYLTELSLTTGELGDRTPLPAEAAGPLYDRQDRLVGMGYYGAVGGDIVFFEPKLEAAWRLLRQGLAGKRLSLVSFDAGFDTVVVHAEGPADPGTYYLYDGRSRSVSVIGRDYPDVRPEDVGFVTMIDYTAADGMAQFGYLTLPSDREARNLPLILLPHGGPAARDELTFDWWAQAMASRGYAVFQPQFRGSAGFGQAYLEAGYGEYGRKMQTDLVDAVNHLAAQGIIDPARVCIVGASYGGYAALAGVTMQPDVYRCAVSVNGVSDLPARLAAAAREGGAASDARSSELRYRTRFLGVEDRNDPILARLSPSRLASAVRAPVLLIHGRDDTVVPFNQSVIMERALREAGKTVEFEPLEGEDHSLSYAPTRLRMLERTMSFIETHNPPD